MPAHLAPDIFVCASTCLTIGGYDGKREWARWQTNLVPDLANQIIASTVARAQLRGTRNK